jgi:hypothetical protein
MIKTILTNCGPQKDTYFNLKEQPIDKQRFTFFKGYFKSVDRRECVQSPILIYIGLLTYALLNGIRKVDYILREIVLQVVLMIRLPRNSNGGLVSTLLYKCLI